MVTAEELRKWLGEVPSDFVIEYAIVENLDNDEEGYGGNLRSIGQIGAIVQCEEEKLALLLSKEDFDKFVGIANLRFDPAETPQEDETQETQEDEEDDG